MPAQPLESGIGADSDRKIGNHINDFRELRGKPRQCNHQHAHQTWQTACEHIMQDWVWRVTEHADAYESDAGQR